MWTLFESTSRKSYTFDDEGRLSPLHNNPDSVWEADAVKELWRLDKFYEAHPKNRQLTKAGSAYTGSQGSLTMILIFDEIGEGVFASINGGTEPIDHVRYYFVGTKPEALLTIAYTPGEQAHFLVLMEYRSSLVTAEEVFYDMNTIYRWDDVSGSPAVSPQERPTLPTGRSQSGDSQSSELASPPLVTVPEWFSLYGGREWVFGRGAQNTEYFMVPIRQCRSDTEDAPLDRFPPTRAIILQVDYQGVTHYYETFVGSSRMTETCFFGIQEWEYPLSDGRLERPLKERILSMDHPVTKELNDLCTEGSLYIREPTVLEDWEPDLGNYTGSVGNGTLTVKLTVEGRENWGLPENHIILAHA
ncbi:hypothetical protein FOZ63_014877 [Perkinsus olseni]|uniref:Uncharacterized protein n=1 Tax=Perkinsus olseni TaxID=32597 RepID=A0A7J6QJ48_PEROL|nr:hypothetical protein FOZ63_014877 [Perkinsus olseni]